MDGITRDEAALELMAAMVSTSESSAVWESGSISQAATQAYRMVDALIAASQRGKEK